MSFVVFVPGRTELAGNHTDHQNGRILASAVAFGITAECEMRDDNLVQIYSSGFEPFEVKVAPSSVVPADYGTSRALVRGVLEGFRELGLSVGGFRATVTSTLPIGAGFSSSAAFSVLIAKILSILYNNNSLTPIVIARIAQEAENRFFGKPCGLMDQLTCALGKCIYVDFSTGEIQPITADFDAMGLTLCLTNTGGSHAGLETSYARIPADMCRIANLFDKGVLADVDPEEFRKKGWSAEDRPVRRAMHFFGENDRVPRMRDALIAKDADLYLHLMNESGRSSENLLNNIVTSATGDRKLEEGLELSSNLLDGKGAWRVHGGGFAGSVQALMPNAVFPEYKSHMEEKFGTGSCIRIQTL